MIFDRPLSIAHVAGRALHPPRHHHGAPLPLLKTHGNVYVMEAAELGVFMVLASAVSVLFAGPGSPLRVRDAVLQRLLIGLSVGVSAIAIIYSPLGRRSGAHFNPAVTVTFLRLHMVKTWDAVFYVTAQFAGGVLGITLAAAALGHAFTAAPVSYIVTRPGTGGVAGAFVAEAAIAFIMMTTILTFNSHRSLTRFTGVAAGCLLVVFVLLEAPISGMSMNPARSFGSALLAAQWRALWLYFLAPVFGMVLAAQAHVSLLGWRVHSARLSGNHARCIFQCASHEREATA